MKKYSYFRFLNSEAITGVWKFSPYFNVNFGHAMAALELFATG